VITRIHGKRDNLLYREDKLVGHEWIQGEPIIYLEDIDRVAVSDVPQLLAQLRELVTLVAADVDGQHHHGRWTAPATDEHRTTDSARDPHAVPGALASPSESQYGGPRTPRPHGKRGGIAGA